MDFNLTTMPWWETEKERQHGPLLDTVKAILANNEIRNQANLRYARLYGNVDILGLSPGDYFKTGSSIPFQQGSRLTFNVIKSMVDTVSAKIAKNKPRPVFLTNNGDWELQQKAKLMNQWVLGVLYETDAYKLGPIAFRDACIWGNGCIKIYEHKGRIKMERVFISELIVDQTESVYGKPQTMYQKKHVNRHVLLSMFKKDEKAVQAIKHARNSALNGTDANTVTDTVEVIEAWKLPSGKGEADGRHSITIENYCLFDEEYTRNRFPFVFFQWTEPVIGFYGIGLAEELIGIQLEINKLLRQIQLSHHLLSTPKVLLENGAQIVSSHINNEVGAIIKYTGTPPQIASFQTVHPEIYQHLERLYQRAYEIAGVSLLSAGGKKPSGLDSGKALREYQDIESERFALQQQRYEQFFVDITSHCVELAREIGKSYLVKAPNKKVIEQIDFKEINLEESTYVLQCFPTNFLPSTPAGRLQSVQELLASGLISQEGGLSLLDFPDLESEMSLVNSPRDSIMLHLDKILMDGQYMPPEPYLNLPMAQKLTHLVYLKSKVDGVPEEKLELLRRFMNEVQLLMGLAQAGAAPVEAPVPNAPVLASAAGLPASAPAPMPVVPK